MGCVDKYRHGRQLIKLAGTNPSSRDTGQSFGKVRRMTRRGRAGMRHVLYMAAISRLLHNPAYAHTMTGSYSGRIGLWQRWRLSEPA